MNPVFAKLKRSQIIKDTSLVFIGKVSNAALSFISTILLSRALGPEDFGVFTAITALLIIIMNFCDFGLGTSTIRYVSEFLKKNQMLHVSYIAILSLKVRIFLAVIVIFLGLLLAKPISYYLLNNNSYVDCILILMSGVLPAILLNYFESLQISYSNYKHVVIMNLIVGLSRVVMVCGVIFLYNTLPLSFAIWIYVLGLFFGVIYGLLKRPQYHRWDNEFEKQYGDQLKKILFGFSKWVILTSLISTIAMQVDIFMLGKNSTLQELGIYSTAQKLAFIFPILTGILNTILLPKVSIMDSKTIRVYFKKVLLLIPLVSILVIISIYLSTPVIGTLFGAQYTGSIIVFKVLVIGFGFTTIFTPLGLILYNLKKPYYYTLLALAQLIINVSLNLYTIPNYGALGAAYSTLIVKIFSLIFIVIVLKLILKKELKTLL